MAKRNIKGTQQMDGKQQAIDNAIAQIEKQFGQGAIMRLGGEMGNPLSQRLFQRDL